jgi:hypothetical protein
MIAIGNTTDSELNFKLGDIQVHSIWQGDELRWPINSGLVFINANWRVVPPWPVFAEVWTSDGGAPPTLITKLWTSSIFNVTSTGCMNFGVYGPLPNNTQQYVVRIRKIATTGDPERNIVSAGSTAGYGTCPVNNYLETAADGGQVFISGNQVWDSIYPQLVFDIFSVS